MAGERGIARVDRNGAPSCGFEPQTTRLTAGSSTRLSYDGPPVPKGGSVKRLPGSELESEGGPHGKPVEQEEDHRDVDRSHRPHGRTKPGREHGDRDDGRAGRERGGRDDEERDGRSQGGGVRGKLEG